MRAAQPGARPSRVSRPPFPLRGLARRPSSPPLHAAQPWAQLAPSPRWPSSPRSSRVERAAVGTAASFPPVGPTCHPSPLNKTSLSIPRARSPPPACVAPCPTGAALAPPRVVSPSPSPPRLPPPPLGARPGHGGLCAAMAARRGAWRGVLAPPGEPPAPTPAPCARPRGPLPRRARVCTPRRAPGAVACARARTPPVLFPCPGHGSPASPAMARGHGPPASTCPARVVSAPARPQARPARGPARSAPAWSHCRSRRAARLVCNSAPTCARLVRDR
jgi:hypothetical protein